MLPDLLHLNVSLFMQKIISVSLASLLMIIIITSILIFHILVISGVVPYTIIWGGKIKSHGEMISFTSISIAINSLMILIVLMRIKIINFNNHPVKIRVALWIMVILFGLNTLGNLFSQTILEKIIFTPLTVLLAILSYRLAMKERVEK